MTIRAYADTLSSVKQKQRAVNEENRMPTSEQTIVKRVTELVAADSVGSPDPCWYSSNRRQLCSRGTILEVAWTGNYCRGPWLDRRHSSTQ